MSHIKLKNLLAENMCRFRTKNLNEAVLSDTFYVYYENEEGSNTMNFSYKVPKVTTLNDYEDNYSSYGPTTDSIVYELLKYSQKQKNNDYANTNLDDYVAAIDNWYMFLQDMAKEAGLTIYGSDDEDDFEEGDEWKRNLYSDDDDDDDDDDDETFSDTPVRKTLQLRNGIQLDVTFIKGVSDKYAMEAIYKCKVKGSKSISNQIAN